MKGPAAATSALIVEKLTIRRGNKVVVNDVSLSVFAGKVTALLGPNGAGKSSLVQALAGVLPTSSGQVVLDGKDITHSPPDMVRWRGVAAVPEGHQVLATLSVDDNLKAAGSMLARGALTASLEEVYAVFPELAERRRQAAATLSGGQQQMVAIGHALIGRPAFLLIDEMSLGLAPVIVKRLMDLVADLARRGVGILLIEQFTHLALRLADHACVMSRAELRFSGTPHTLVANPELLHSAYLGSAT